MDKKEFDRLVQSSLERINDGWFNAVPRFNGSCYQVDVHGVDGGNFPKDELQSVASQVTSLVLAESFALEYLLEQRISLWFCSDSSEIVFCFNAR